jgi:tetratricopeptide (TPR) repeat protein
MKKLLSLTLLLCTPVLLPPAQPPLLAQPAPAASPQPQPEVQALIVQGRVALTARKFDEALRLFEQALVRARAIKDRVGEATALNGIGASYNNIGQPQKALEFFNQALPLSREVGDKIVEAKALTNLGVVYADIGQRQKAVEFYNQALPLLRETSNKSGEADALGNIG